ncbi:serine hydrolase domain-containing protein [Biformimicrobium ophioploci]|uniref:Serine hydrolase domain-containing protein n=1 Tax=Biformimicrobium ophioploci TaxID=3036711 RepID=A0ABQ6LZB3_9GAMM|nr:serine hydrolase domain-containing protein [Microbulbifer sp. NKW57]GMG87438.1 serine hydrolase domain-containing protein [Microbulbifer sp. NKW57]
MPFRCYRFFYAILFAVASAASPVLLASDIQQSARYFDKYFRQAIKDKRIPGAAYVIVERDKVVAMKTYGVKTQGKKDPIDKNTVFRLASVSKTFAGTVAALLEQEEKFGWDDRVINYVPELKFKTRNLSSKLTVGHLLSHSSGLVPNAYDNMLEASKSVEQILPKFSLIDPFCPPGQCYGYQNVLFSLIERVIEKSTGVAYEEHLQERVFTPLKMENASIGYKAFTTASNRATPHVKTRKGWRAVKVKKGYYFAPSAAGVNTSITDLAEWLKAHMGFYPKVLAPETIAEITQQRIETKQDRRRRIWRDYVSDAGYGLGWRIYSIGDDRVIYHGGWVAGFRAAVAYSENEKIGIAILMNAESKVINEMTANFIIDITGKRSLAKLVDR